MENEAERGARQQRNKAGQDEPVAKHSRAGAAGGEYPSISFPASLPSLHPSFHPSVLGADLKGGIWAGGRQSGVAKAGLTEQ